MLISHTHLQKEVDRLLGAYLDSRLGRRPFLRRALALGLSFSAASSLLAACGGKATNVSLDVLNNWSGEEQASFQAVVAPFTNSTGISINIEATRDLNAALNTRLNANDPPDIAVIPNPAQLRQMASQQQLFPLDAFLDMQQMRKNYDSDWLNLASYQDHLYALVYRVSNKGTIWYNPIHFQAHGYALPQTWDDLIALSDSIANNGAYPWSLGINSGETTGWPAADWIAEIYLRQFGATLYDQWVNHQIPWTHASLKTAFQLFGQIVGNRQYIAGAPQSVLGNGYEMACYEPFSTPPQVYMDYLGDFAIGFITNKFPTARPGLDFNFFPFPVLDPHYSSGITVGADLVVAMRNTEAVQLFMTYLSTAQAQTIWVKRGGANSVNLDVNLENYPDDVARASVRMLVDTQNVRLFGAGDMMPFPVEQAFWRGLQNFIRSPDQLDGILRQIEVVAQLAYSS
jgi:alpha-glucoside transport system substrate-binding protein